MMSDIVRRSEQCSPKTSPRGNRSPVVVPRQDSTGTLKTTISLGKTPAIVHSGPFYLMKELPPPSELTGGTNLIQYHNLEHSFNKFCGRKIKDQLSSFLPNLPGNIDVPACQDDSSLRKIIERPPITSIEIVPLNKQQLDSAFRLHVGPVPNQYRFMSQAVPRKKHKHKKSKTKGLGGDSPINEMHAEINNEMILSREHEKKHKKQKRHDDEKERRKKKKDKKKKKRHSPDSPPYDVMNLDDSPMPMSVASLIGPGTPQQSNSNLATPSHQTSSMIGSGMISSSGLISSVSAIHHSNSPLTNGSGRPIL
ncbi:Mediator of RNA polymerase II transcription subunit 19 [Sarcoptes scabiei]|uniref:Mediator of RNA polymerase II transcription subunit 19 n=1 Tax=Sarcoptes scabiei TaxID=52283 RepID=A0A834R444_SARSC|nr:Mediator of RNA polymerase II transcription subunit 19 [Sarcoptes scabiei]